MDLALICCSDGEPDWCSHAKGRLLDATRRTANYPIVRQAWIEASGCARDRKTCEHQQCSEVSRSAAHWYPSNTLTDMRSIAERLERSVATTCSQRTRFGITKPTTNSHISRTFSTSSRNWTVSRTEVVSFIDCDQLPPINILFPTKSMNCISSNSLNWR